MEQVFSYIISLGASVMMPIIFTVIGLCIGMKFGKALKSGLFVGVGFVGLGVVTALLTTNFNDPLKAISDIYHLQLNVFDMGWPAAAAVAYNTSSGSINYPNLSGCQLPDVDYQDNTYRKYRPLELLALRLYRCGGLLRDGSEFALGLFRSYRLLHQHAGLCRPDSRQIPEILRFGWYLNSAAILPEFHAIRYRLQQALRYDSGLL